MRLHFHHPSTRPLHPFSRLGMWYIIALGVIAIVIISGQILVQSHLSNQERDSRVVNVAGKQRMLSQKITKTVLLLSARTERMQRETLLNELTASMALWEKSHRALHSGDDSLGIPAIGIHRELAGLFAEVNPHFERIRTSGHEIIGLLQHDLTIAPDSLTSDVQNILDHEEPFLAGMEKIALRYATHAETKVSSLSRMVYALLAISLGVILLEIIFIFRPTVKNVNKTVNQLISSEQNARKLSKEIGALYASLEKSYEQVAMVNQPPDNPRLYAKSDRGGNIFFIADNFRSVGGEQTARPGMRIADLFTGMAEPDDWMDDVVDTVSTGQFWQGELQFMGIHGKTCWVNIIITPVFNGAGEVEELLVTGCDTSQQKEAEHNMKRKNRAEIEKKINQQKFRSVLILEGQEEERNRIAMDIHDGIGQMLTSLKYQIESIDLKTGEKAVQKIRELDQLIKQVIREVRRVTFNLKPTVLGDYGLQAALNVFVQETAKVVDIKLAYKTSGEIDRLPQKIENNIFRIIQEAINNAIKYSGAELIEVTLWQDESNMVITVRDEGKGFDTKIVEARSVNIESGRGFFNMYERTDYVNGELSIESAPGSGTTVRLSVPVRNKISADV